MRSCISISAIVAAALMLTTNASAETFKTSVGKRVFITKVRGPCTGSSSLEMSTLKSWMASTLKHGSLELGPSFKEAAGSRSKCPGKATIWKRKMYYVGSAKGSDTIAIKFPDNGMLKWTVKVE